MQELTIKETETITGGVFITTIAFSLLFAAGYIFGQKL